ncbi:unnamed protein product [Diamesa hyperborea]
MPTMNWGSIVAEKNLNPFFKILVRLLKKTAPMAFQKFPWIGKFGVYNLSVENESFFSMFPKGDYKVDFVFGDEEDDQVYGAKIESSLTSSVKIHDAKQVT